MARGEYKNCTRVTITINNEILAELDRKAEELGCPRSVYIGMALKAKWQQEDNLRNMPMMYATLSRVATVMEDYKNDPAMVERMKLDQALLDSLKGLPE